MNSLRLWTLGSMVCVVGLLAAINSSACGSGEIQTRLNPSGDQKMVMMKYVRRQLPLRDGASAGKRAVVIGDFGGPKVISQENFAAFAEDLDVGLYSDLYAMDYRGMGCNRMSIQSFNEDDVRGLSVSAGAHVSDLLELYKKILVDHADPVTGETPDVVLYGYSYGSVIMTQLAHLVSAQKSLKKPKAVLIGGVVANIPENAKLVEKFGNSHGLERLFAKFWVRQATEPGEYKKLRHIQDILEEFAVGDKAKVDLLNDGMFSIRVIQALAHVNKEYLEFLSGGPGPTVRYDLTFYAKLFGLSVQMAMDDPSWAERVLEKGEGSKVEPPGGGGTHAQLLLPEELFFMQSVIWDRGDFNSQYLPDWLAEQKKAIGLKSTLFVLPMYDISDFPIDIPLIYFNGREDVATSIYEMEHHWKSQTSAAKAAVIPHSMGHADIESEYAGCIPSILSAIAGLKSKSALKVDRQAYVKQVVEHAKVTKACHIDQGRTTILLKNSDFSKIPGFDEGKQFLNSTMEKVDRM